MRPSPRVVNDLGAGTVIAVSLIAVIAGLLTLMLSTTNQFLEKTRLEAIADNAAIAGADSLRGLIAGAPCDVARELVLSGSARIISCSINQTDLLIELERNGLTARARAGEPIEVEN